MDIEDKINLKLRLRGFDKAITNNRGLIGAVIDEMILILSKERLKNE